MRSSASKRITSTPTFYSPHKPAEVVPSDAGADAGPCRRFSSVTRSWSEVYEGRPSALLVRARGTRSLELRPNCSRIDNFSDAWVAFLRGSSRCAVFGLNHRCRQLRDAGLHPGAPRLNGDRRDPDLFRAPHASLVFNIVEVAYPTFLGSRGAHATQQSSVSVYA